MSEETFSLYDRKERERERKSLLFPSWNHIETGEETAGDRVKYGGRVGWIAVLSFPFRSPYIPLSPQVHMDGIGIVGRRVRA